MIAADGAFSIAVNGAALAGEARNVAGEALVLIHGMAGDRHEWDRLLAVLPSDLPVVRYDLRGFGRSSALDGAPYSHTEDLLGLLDALDIARAALCGLSMGGGVALNFALSHPHRVSRLVLISPAMVGWEWSDVWRGLWHAVSQAARAGDMARARALWFGHPMFAAIRQTELAEDLRASLAGYHGHQWMRDYQRDALPDVDRLHTLAMPTLLLTGEHDVEDLRLIADVIAAAAPHLERVDFAEAGHMLHLERTTAVRQAIATFLT